MGKCDCGCGGIKIEEKTESKSKLAKMYKVILHNDDVNSMHEVIRSLVEIFRFDVEKANQIMWEAHNNGLALCKVEPFEHAELHRDQLKTKRLVSTIEPE